MAWAVWKRINRALIKSVNRTGAPPATLLNYSATSHETEFYMYEWMRKELSYLQADGDDDQRKEQGVVGM